MQGKSLVQIILLNAYYVGVAIAFLIKDILWLRIIMILAGICMIIQGWLDNNQYIIMWISLFTVINILQVIRILYENRKIKLPPDLLDLYELTFSDMKRKEFLLFWNQGMLRKAAPGELICREGENNNEIILILKGQVRISKDKRQIAILKRGFFAAEMSYLTDRPPSADIIAMSELEYMSWEFSTLDRIKEVYPEIHNRLQLIISKDLTNKLKKYLD